MAESHLPAWGRVGAKAALLGAIASIFLPRT